MATVVTDPASCPEAGVDGAVAAAARMIVVMVLEIFHMEPPGLLAEAAFCAPDLL